MQLKGPARNEMSMRDPLTCRLWATKKPLSCGLRRFRHGSNRSKQRRNTDGKTRSVPLVQAETPTCLYTNIHANQTNQQHQSCPKPLFSF